MTLIHPPINHLPPPPRRPYTATMQALLPLLAVAVKPNLIMILQDDLGHYDLGLHNPDARAYTENITALAAEGILLTNHYTHWHCSPTRRSFLSGRLPIHHGEQLSGIATDDIDLRMTWISEKLQPAGYKSFWYGKGHTGYKSMQHLGANRGFDNVFGFLSGSESYTSDTKWQGQHPVHSDAQFDNPPPGMHPTTYSSQLLGELAVQAVEGHDTTVPLFMYLAFQAVHTPYDKVPGNPMNSTYHGMVWDADVYVGLLVDALKAKGMYDNTVIVYTSDNGGVVDGINYPLRGEKHSNWEGGMRTAAFVSGGLVPTSLRGTNNTMNLHIVDWYATFCELAGVDHSDDPATPPLPTNISDPTKDIYGNLSYPGVDGVPVWNMLMNPDEFNYSSAHENLVLSKEVVIHGQYKLLVSQPFFKTQNSGWKQPDGTWVAADAKEWPCMAQDLPPANGVNVFPGSGKGVCLFDLRADASEKVNIASQEPTIVASLWQVLNESALAARDCSGWSGPIPGPQGSCSPQSLLGNCNSSCAQQYWNNNFPGALNAPGPICGVPTC